MMKVLNVPEYMMENRNNYPGPGTYVVRGEIVTVTERSVTRTGKYVEEQNEPEKPVEVTEPIKDISFNDITDPCFYQLILNVVLATSCALLALGYAA